MVDAISWANLARELDDTNEAARIRQIGGRK